MESDVSGFRSRVVLKTVSRLPGTFINQLYAVDLAVAAWVSLSSLSYTACALYLANQGRNNVVEEQVAAVEWTYQVQTAAFGAVLLLNVLNLGMRQHLLPFKCNLLLLFINSVAFVTDLLLWRRATLITASTSGRPFAPLRYVQWCHSTPTMIYMLALMADCSDWKLVIPLLSDVAMVISGLAAAYTVGLAKGACTFISFGTFVVVVYYVEQMFRKVPSGDMSPEQRSTLRTVLAMLLILWSAFPVVWLAAELHLMGPHVEAVCWGVCDYLAKVVFSSQLWQSNLTGVQLRRDRALEAWEASNRVEAVARLTALLKQRDDLLSTLSHELRTPLAGIVALTESLCKDVPAALPACGHTLFTVRATATCMLNIITSTLDSFAARRGELTEGLMPSHSGDVAACVGSPGSCMKGEACGVDGGGSAGDDGAVPLGVVDLRPLIETVTLVLRPLAHDGVAVVNDLPHQLPLVTADATRLSQVLYNLVGNAMRFTSHGEVRISAKVILPEGAEPAATAEVRTMPTRSDSADTDAATATATATAMAGVAAAANVPSGGGSRWRYRRPRVSTSTSTSSICSCQGPLPLGSVMEVSVEDTGVGIPQDLLDELFLPYRTGNTRRSGVGHGGSPSCSASSSAFGGTGLGLYLVRLALRALGSDITAESAPGLGSVFRFRLPVAPYHLQQQHQTPHKQDSKRAKADKDPSPLQPCDEGDGVPAAALTAAAHHVLGDKANELRASFDAVLNGGAVTERNTRPSSPGSPPTWVASAKARLAPRLAAKVYGSGRGGCSTGGAAAGTPVGSAPAAAFQVSPPHSAQLERLRRSLDEQRCQRRAAQAANAVAGNISASAGPCCGGADRGERNASCDVTQLGPLDVGGCRLGVGVACAECTALNGASSHCGSPVPSVKAAMAASVLARNAIFPGGITGTAAVPTQLPAPSLEGSDAAVAAAAPARVQAPARQNYRHRNSGTLQVLSVDDDPINQLVAGQMISSQSWKVVKCMNGPEALAHLHLSPSPAAKAQGDGQLQPPSPAPGGGGGPQPSSQDALSAAMAAALPLLPIVLPDIVLLDVMMPGMSGFEVCRRLREHFSPAELVIIIVSAKCDSAAVEEAFESGADDYMTKPLKRSEMVARIKAQIRIRDSAAAATAAQVEPMTLATLSWTTASSQVHSPIPGAGSGTGALAGSGLTGTQLPAPSEICASTARGLLMSGLRNDRPASSSWRIGSSASINVDSGGGGGMSTGGGDGGRLQHHSDSTDAVAADGGLPAGEKEPLCPRQPQAQAFGLAAIATAPAGAVVPASLHSSQSPIVSGRRLKQPLNTTTMTTTTTVGSGGAPAEAPQPPPSSSPLAATTTMTRADAVQPLLSHELGGGAAAAAAAVTASAVGTSSSSLHVLPAAASVAPTDVTLGGGSGMAGDAVLALMHKVLSEVRRGRAVEANVAKLHSRVATLQVACGTLAAERDGWRRQARDLRALLAAGVGGGGGAAAAASTAAWPPLSMSSHTAAGSAAVMAATMDGAAASNGAAARCISCGAAAAGGCLSPTAPEHLTCSRSSVDSGGGALLLAATGAGPVTAQLDDLKREAAKLRQQLSIALASMGNGSISTALGAGLSCGDVGNGNRALVVPSSTNTRRDLVGPPATPPTDSMLASGVTDPGPSGAEPTSPWAVAVMPNPTFVPAGNGPDLFLTTTVSGLSGDQAEGHASGDGAVAAAAASPRQSLAVRTPMDILEPAKSPVPVVLTKLSRAHVAREATTATDATGPQSSPPPPPPAATLDASGVSEDVNVATSGVAVVTTATSPTLSLLPVYGDESAVATVSDLCENTATTASNACPSFTPTGRRSDEDVLLLQSQQSQQSHSLPAQQQQQQHHQCSSTQPPVAHAAAAAAAPAPVVSSPLVRSSRSRAVARGTSGTGLLRLLCSKGALPGASSGEPIEA